MTADGKVGFLGPGDAVVADRMREHFFVLATGRLSELAIDGTVVGGPWEVPEGWGLPNDGRGVPAVDGSVILETTGANRSDQEIAVWRPEAGRPTEPGDLRVIGTARWVYDTTVTVAGQELLAWVDTSSCGADGAGCGLVVTDLNSGLSLVNPAMTQVCPARPKPQPIDKVPAGPGPCAGVSQTVGFSSGYIGGGAFSPNGSRLTVSVALYEGSVNPRATIVVLDTNSLQRGLGTTTEAQSASVRTTAVEVGEPYTALAWSTDGSRLAFVGLTEPQLLDVRTGQSEAFVGVDWSYSIATLG